VWVLARVHPLCPSLSLTPLHTHTLTQHFNFSVETTGSLRPEQIVAMGMRELLAKLEMIKTEVSIWECVYVCVHIIHCLSEPA
jgi:hypothetical protein